ncbi:MAG: hypothetical protein ABJN75_21090 [Hoeflea sp.]|uniref:hypothetical protein n=1 Tax=Hoeflea sp. TaxID=1940281 RepID=UPI0032979680
MLVTCGPDTGLGHLRRMQVLARALSGRGARIGWCVDGVAALAGEEAVAFDRNSEFTSDILVVDGYNFDLASLRSGFGGLLCVVDDLCDRPIDADVVVNHNLYAPDLNYLQASTCLLGPGYALIDPEFGRISPGGAGEDGDILVTLGGARRFCVLAVELAGEIARQNGRTVGVAVPEPLSDVPIPQSVRLECNEPMVGLFLRYRNLVTGLGVSYLEALASGKPLYGISLIDNQQEALGAAAKLGLPVSPLLAPKQLATGIVRELARPFSSVRLIDGHGSSRVADVLMRAL